jgi:hypothetical protein
VQVAEPRQADGAESLRRPVGPIVAGPGRFRHWIFCADFYFGARLCVQLLTSFQYLNARAIIVIRAMPVNIWAKLLTSLLRTALRTATDKPYKS